MTWSWWLFSLAVSLVTGGILVRREWRFLEHPAARPRITSALLVLARLLVGVGVMGFGYLLEPVVRTALDADMSAGLAELQSGFSSALLPTLLSGVFPGSVVTFAATSGAMTSEKVQRGGVAAIATLMLLDSFWNLFALRPIEQYFFSLFSDLVGGAIAGGAIGLVAEVTSVERSGKRTFAQAPPSNRVTRRQS